MKILITGSAGFIGFHTAKKLLEKKHIIYGLYNLDNYYDVKLKNRLKILKQIKKFNFLKINLINKKKLEQQFKKKFDLVINLAAQAGVRFSIKNPPKYFNSNILGFFNLIEASRKYKIKKVVSASTSSVYGENKKLPFKEVDRVDNIQFYAASKRSNEIIGEVYSKIYDMNFIFLRFLWFMVHGEGLIWL